MKNKIDDLRNHLFETLEMLKDEEKPMDIARANAVVNVATAIVNSVKAETNFLRTAGRLDRQEFFPPVEPPGEPPRLLTDSAVAAEVSTPLRICDHCKRRTRLDPCEHCKQAWKRSA